MIIVYAVVFDLELVKRFRKGQPSEIVEIGACKVDLTSKEIVDRFQVYISPRKGYVEKSTRTFINMTIEDMMHAVPFREGIMRFVEWLGDQYYLCSWGKDDRIHLIDECIRKKVSLDWLVNYNDIQKQIGALLREDNKNQLGLQNALELAGIEPQGLAHRGVDDALNTARLFILFADRIKLQTNEVTKKEIRQFKLRLQRKNEANRSASPSSPASRSPLSPPASGGQPVSDQRSASEHLMLARQEDRQDHPSGAD